LRTFPELVREGEEGYLVPNGDLDAFAERVARLVHDPALRKRLGGRARERARFFSHERFVAEMSAVYRELLAMPAKRAR
jgi:glycosyltransferase involved in cell wall biosynthesis